MPPKVSEVPIQRVLDLETTVEDLAGKVTGVVEAMNKSEKETKESFKSMDAKLDQLFQLLRSRNLQSAQPDLNLPVIQEESAPRRETRRSPVDGESPELQNQVRDSNLEQNWNSSRVENQVVSLGNRPRDKWLKKLELPVCDGSDIYGWMLTGRNRRSETPELQASEEENSSEENNKIVGKEVESIEATKSRQGKAIEEEDSKSVIESVKEENPSLGVTPFDTLTQGIACQLFDVMSLRTKLVKCSRKKTLIKTFKFKHNVETRESRTKPRVKLEQKQLELIKIREIKFGTTKKNARCWRHKKEGGNFCRTYYFSVWHCWRHKKLQKSSLMLLFFLQQNEKMKIWWMLIQKGFRPLSFLFVIALLFVIVTSE